jgi:hypothetical protein
VSAHAAAADLAILELVEHQRRSVAMLPTGVPARNCEQALELLEQPQAARRDVEELRTQDDARRVGRGCHRTRVARA